MMSSGLDVHLYNTILFVEYSYDLISYIMILCIWKVGDRDSPRYITCLEMAYEMSPLDVFRVLVEGGATLDMRSSVRELNCTEGYEK